jgi:hypothetical protein
MIESYDDSENNYELIIKHKIIDEIIELSALKTKKIVPRLSKNKKIEIAQRISKKVKSREIEPFDLENYIINFPLKSLDLQEYKNIYSKDTLKKNIYVSKKNIDINSLKIIQPYVELEKIVKLFLMDYLKTEKHNKTENNIDLINSNNFYIIERNHRTLLSYLKDYETIKSNTITIFDKFYNINLHQHLELQNDQIFMKTGFRNVRALSELLYREIDQHI